MDLCVLTQGCCPPVNTSQPIVPDSINDIGLFLLLYWGREGAKKGLVEAGRSDMGERIEGWRYSFLNANLTILQGLSKSPFSKVLKSLTIYLK